MSDTFDDLVALRRPGCSLCKMADGADVRCVVASGDLQRPELLVITKHPLGDARTREITDMLESVGFTRVAITAVVKCRNYQAEPSKADLKTCASVYLADEIALVNAEIVMPMGNEALQGVLGKSGIMKYRGRVFDGPGNSKVVPTLSYSAALRNPRQMPGMLADVEFAARLAFGEKEGTPKPKLFKADDKAKLRKLKLLLEQTAAIAYDIETTGGDEFDPDAAIVSVSFAGELKSGREFCAVLPLYHPESPFRRAWRQVLTYLSSAIENVPSQTAHNGKFDSRWLRQYGVQSKVTFDTMLAIHTLDEGAPKGLKPAARSKLGVDPWDISTSSLLTTPLRKVLHYNALDSWYTWHIRKLLKADLDKEPDLKRLYRAIVIPANAEYIEAERRGIWVSSSRLATSLHVKQSELDMLEDAIHEHLPARDEAWPTNAKGKQLDINLNPSNFLRWLLFDHLGLPIVARGKDKDDGTPGDPSVAEAVMMELKPKHAIIDLLLQRSVLVKHVQFLTSYDATMDDRGRIHTTFKQYGTVTGRTSSGKAGDDKLVGRALATRRGVNIQQVPRDSSVRGVFGAPPEYAFVSADYSQVELRVVAFLSRDEQMLSVYQNDQDIHMMTAMSVLGVPEAQVSKEQRKGAKAVNFGFVYGMSANKFVLTAREKYEMEYTDVEARGMRDAYFRTYAGLKPWHDLQRRVVRKYGRVRSPLGRVRNLPDIYSPDRGVQAEAERQAINSPVQSFASDLTLLSMVIASRRMRKAGLRAYTVGTVHDEVNYEVHRDDLARALPIIRRTMEHLPLERLFGLYVDVPMRCDIEVSAQWGRGRELSVDEIEAWSDDKYDELVEGQR